MKIKKDMLTVNNMNNMMTTMVMAMMKMIDL